MSTLVPESKNATLAIVSAATSLALIIFTVPLTTVVATVEALNTGPGMEPWILSGMPLGAATALLGAGSLGDNFNRRLVFLWGLAVMTIASAVAALAPSGLILVLARVAQGFGSAAVLACGLGLIGQVFTDHHEQIKATGIWAAALGSGVATGPIIAALATMAGGWRAAHWATGVLALALFIGGMAKLPHSDTGNNSRFDWLGALLLLCGLALVMSGLTESRQGWSEPLPLSLIGAGVMVLAIFVWVEHRHNHPMLDLSLFRYPDFIGATVAAFASGAGVLALMTLVPAFLQRTMDMSALLASFALLAWSVTSVPQLT